MTRTIIKGGTIVNADGTLEADLIIEGEQIAGIVRGAGAGPDDTVIDAAGMLVLPGVVDAHTHIQLDTGIYKTADNWEIGTKAAAAGGVTTVIDFANQIVGESFEKALDARKAQAADAVIDYCFHMVVIEPAYEDDALRDELQHILDLGMNSVKLFTTYRPNYYLDDVSLYRIFKALPDGLIAMIHAENDDLVTAATQQLISEGKTGWRYHGESRPDIAEEEAINRVVYLARRAYAIIYLAHCTTFDSIMTIIEAREKNQLVLCETCPQYLVLDSSLYDGPEPEHYILQPPLRYQMIVDEPIRRGELWGELRNFNVISTDSCDYTLAQKTQHNDFTKTPGGLPGLETLLPLMYTYAVHEKLARYFSVSELIKKISVNPAKIFGLYPRKGVLQAGSDADVVLYDPKPESTITHTNLHYVSGYSPYEGMRVKGRVVKTLSRGTVIYDADKDDPFEGAAIGRGQFVPGKPFDRNLKL